ncbi:MAG TPA: SBBP repeat-containing protein, partial [Candidatus Solibacter sp.]|nr:SBBP repeat-containing protein [Candidatus Solibacter sp.]
GSLAYSTFLGGTGEDSANAIAIDSAGNAYFTGNTTSGDLPMADAFQKSNAGVVTAYVAALDATGSSLLFSSYLGGKGGTSPSATVGDFGNAVVMNCASGLVVVGTTSSTDFPTTAGSFATAYLGGGSDAFVAKISAGGTPALALGGVLNSASNGVGPVAPGSLVTVYGSSMAVTTQTALSAPWGINLGGASVAVNGSAVPLYFAGANQINFQLPYETRPGVASLTVTTPCGASVPASFQVAQAAPYIFQRADGTAIVQNIVPNQDPSINGPGNGAKAGSVVTVYLTGIGPLDNAVATGAAASTTTLSRATLPVHVTIGNFDTIVQFLGLTPGLIGLAQANLFVPNLSPGQYPIVIGIGGIASNPATMFVQ